jgi:hypothetical protein
MRDRSDRVHDHAECEQQHHALPGPLLPPAQGVREHQQQQAHDDVGDPGEEAQHARRDLVELVQRVLEVVVERPAPQALDDVAEANQQRQQRSDDRHPAALVPAVRRAAGQHAVEWRRRRRNPARGARVGALRRIAGFGLFRLWPAAVSHLGHLRRAPDHGAPG